MTTGAPPAVLSGAQKCAILVLLLEEAQAAELLRRMDAAEVRAVGEAMLSVAEIDPAAIDAVLDEFIARTGQVSALDSQGRQVRTLLSRALGTPRAARVIEDLGPPAAARRFAGLDWLDPAGIAALLADEHPQAVAVVLAHLAEPRAAAVLDALPDAARGDLVLRLATLRPVAPAAIGDLEADLDAKLAATASASDEAALAGTDFTARLIKASRHRSALLQTLAGADPDLAGTIAAQQFVFADLAQLSSREMQLVLREVDPARLAIAMKGAETALVERILAAMSSRAAAQLQDELAEQAPLKRAEVEAARAEICAAVQRLGDSGAVMLPGAAGAYV